MFVAWRCNFIRKYGARMKIKFEYKGVLPSPTYKSIKESANQLGLEFDVE